MKLTPDDLKKIVASHDFYQIPGSTTIVCLMTTVFGAKVIAHCFGPLDEANFDFEKGCNIAYDKALNQLWDFEGYRTLAEQNLPRVDPVGLTEDMRLPDGSAVFQIILNTKDGQPNIDMRGVLIGATGYDPTNPAHRICGVIQNRISEIVDEATGGEIVQETTDDIEARLRVDPATITPNGNPVDPYLGELDPDRSLPVLVEDDEFNPDDGATGDTNADLAAQAAAFFGTVAADTAPVRGFKASKAEDKKPAEDEPTGPTIPQDPD